MSKMFDDVCDQFNALPTYAKVAIGAAAIVVPYYVFCRCNKKPTLHKTNYKSDVVYLYQFPRTCVIPNLSPYCLKLETWLRMADINYENGEYTGLMRSSKGLLPFIELNGVQYADSGFIIRELIKRFNKTDLDSHLSGEQKAIARAFEQMVENSTVMTYAYVRWVENSKQFMSETVHGKSMPFIFKIPFVRWNFVKSIKKRLFAHGIGRHSREEIFSIAFDDLKALSTYLGGKKFFGGDQPSTIDASLFGFLAQLVYIPIDTPHTSYLKSQCQNLISYTDRMKERYWPDWNETITTRSMHTIWKKK